MSDRGFLFLFSIFMILAGLGAAAWLAVTGQALTVDGLFLVLTALLVALIFSLYVLFVIRSEMAAAKPATAKAKAGAPAATSSKAPAPVA
jgi:predicted membrane protein